jgi:hypothetical protein
MQLIKNRHAKTKYKNGYNEPNAVGTKDQEKAEKETRNNNKK